MVGGGVGRLLTFSAFRMGANSRLGAYSNKYGITILLGYPGGGLCGGECEYDDGVVMDPCTTIKYPELPLISPGLIKLPKGFSEGL